MPLDYFVVGAVATELDRRLRGGRVEKIYQPDREELLFHINVPPDGARPPSRCNLRLSAGSGQPLLYITEKRSGNPQNPPGFCMLLRKHLMGGRILSITPVKGERVVRLDFAVTGELGIHSRRILLLELMGKHSNIFLIEPQTEDGAADVNQRDCDPASGAQTEAQTEANTENAGEDRPYKCFSGFPTGRIQGAIKLISAEVNRYRTTLPGFPYVPPPPARGVSPVMAEELTTGRDLAYYDALADSQAWTPLIFLDDQEKMRDFHVFPLNVYKGMTIRPFPSVSAMMEAWYEGKDAGNRIQQKSADLTKVLKNRIEKLCLKKQRLSEDLLHAEKAEEYKGQADLITANIYRLKKGEAIAELITFDGTATLQIPLDPRLTPARNAQKYYKKYMKAKTAQVEKVKQLKETEEHIAFLESYRVFLDNATTDRDVDQLREELSQLGYVRKRKHGARPASSAPAFLAWRGPSDAIIYAGRNNRENDQLTFKKARQNDLWLHAKDIPGSHVILSSGPELEKDHVRREAAIREAAAVAAWYSKAKLSENVPVDYTMVKYVKKPSGAKPGMVIFTHNRTIYVSPKLPETREEGLR